METIDAIFQVRQTLSSSEALHSELLPTQVRNEIQAIRQIEKHINWNECIHNSHLQFEMACSSISIFIKRQSKKKSIFISGKYSIVVSVRKRILLFNSTDVITQRRWEMQRNWYIQEWYFVNSFPCKNFYYSNVLQDDMNRSTL